ncbi:MAG: hypothetical protein QW743_06115 [Candidatus Methanomethylicia archaeon]
MFFSCNINKRRKGSPLLEEGLLIALAVITMSIVFSMILGILDGVQKMIQNLGFNTQNFANSLNDIWNRIISFLGLGG